MRLVLSHLLSPSLCNKKWSKIWSMNLWGWRVEGNLCQRAGQVFVCHFCHRVTSFLNSVGYIMGYVEFQDNIYMTQPPVSLFFLSLQMKTSDERWLRAMLWLGAGRQMVINVTEKWEQRGKNPGKGVVWTLQFNAWATAWSMSGFWSGFLQESTQMTFKG